MLSIDRLAMQLKGLQDTDAEKMLDRYGFSRSEAAEIVKCCTGVHGRRFGGTMKNIINTIKSTLACSVRIGDRLPDCIKYDNKLNL